MCGITGWIDWQRDLTQQAATLEAMADTLACRGPDASGSWLSARAALGHRRLVVVDPAGGAQPMIRRRGERTFVLVYNGELYNTEEIRRDLQALGYVFQGHSDTEVLLNAYLAWGEASVQRFNGIFAFGIWDETEQSLFMARDRLGVKPLFYAKRAEALVFASEIKALLANPLVEPVVDREGLAELFALGPGRTPGHGVFRGIQELRPGQCLRYSRSGLRVWSYWQLESRPHEDDFPTTVEKVRWLVHDAIIRQLVADVPVCTLLSGGLDSSGITAIAAQHLATRGQGPLHTYSVDYLDNDKHFKANDFQPSADTPYIKLVSDFVGTVHHDVLIDTPQLIDALQEATRARDLPGMADVDTSLLLFCRVIKRDATVVLSGECADEVFGGYPWFRRPDMIEADTFPWSIKLKERLQVMAPGLIERIEPLAYLEARYREALAEVPRLPGESGIEARMREIFYLTLTRWMMTLLDRKDRMSMAVGLEVRVPFCDHRLVEYLWNVPWVMKYHQQREKGLLRQALQGILPEEVLWRRKSPYPKTHNPSYLRATRELLRTVLSDPRSALRDLLDVPALERMLGGHGEFDIPWFGQLMRMPQMFAFLVQVDLWFREYKVRVVD